MSRTERSKRPSSFAKIRSRATFSASRGRVALPVALRHAEQDEQAGADLAGDAAVDPYRLRGKRAGSRPSCRPALSPIHGPWKLRRFRRPCLRTRTAGPKGGRSSARCSCATASSPPSSSTAALAQKEAEGGRLGEILLRYNVATAAAIAQALAEQYGFEFVELSKFDLVSAATSLLPENVARRLSALPIAFDEDETVIVAVTDPTDVMASDDLRLALGLQIRFVVVSVSDLARTLDRCFRANVHVEMESDVLAAEEEAPSRTSPRATSPTRPRSS